jgi:YbbR domain-containing protein
MISEGTLVVSVDIEPEDSKTITMDKQAIVIKNQNNNTKVSFGDSRYFDIIIKGATDVINTVSASNIAMSVDLTSFGEGTHEVPVNITLPSGCSLNQEYTVDIVISNVIQETQSASN